MGKYKTIIFDCDGTLVNTEEVLNAVCASVLRDMGFNEYTKEYCLQNFIGLNVKDLLARLHQDLGEKFDESRFVNQAKKLSREVLCTQVGEMPNASELLEGLGDFPKCVASNGNRILVVESLKTTGLYSYFTEDTIFTYELVLNPKPAADLFLYAAEKMNTRPEECLIIEDSVVGITAAKAAGIDVLAYRNLSVDIPDTIKGLNPTGIITDLKEIISYIK